MFGWISNMNTTAKVSLIMKTLGLDTDETAAADKLVNAVGGHPIVLAATGKEHASLKSVISTVIDSSKEGRVPGAIKVGAKYLDRPEIRASLAELVMDYVERSDDRVPLTRSIEKISVLPLPGLGDREFETHREFLSEGLLPAVSNLIRGDEEGTGVEPLETEECPLVVCPHCEGAFLK